MNKGKKSSSELSALDQAVDAAMAGASYVAVQRLTGVSRSTVRYHVIQRGIARRSVPRSGPKLRAGADVEKAIATVATGISWRRAAEVGGIGLSTLYRHLRGERSGMPGERKRRGSALTAVEREEIRVASSSASPTRRSPSASVAIGQRSGARPGPMGDGVSTEPPRPSSVPHALRVGQSPAGP